MNGQLLTTVYRRDLLHFVAAGAVAAATATIAADVVAADPANSSDKRKARYQANSTEVQDFYRVNRYPVR
jgi:hypothetical protein